MLLAGASLTKVDVVPGNRVLHEPARWQQLAVMATFCRWPNPRRYPPDRLHEQRPRHRLRHDEWPHRVCAKRRSRHPVPIPGRTSSPCGLLTLNPSPASNGPIRPENNYVDKHIFAKLKMLNILPSDTCTDQEFVRRLISMCAASSQQPRKPRPFWTARKGTSGPRWWISSWNDPSTPISGAQVVRRLPSSRKSIQLKAPMSFNLAARPHWKRTTALTRLFREVITAGGSTFSNPPANYFRIAAITSLADDGPLFFGIRMHCAKCKHPLNADAGRLL